jgi:transposase-like protein
MRCSICEKPQVEAISEAMASGESLRATARRFSVPRSTLARHRDNAAIAGMSAKDLPPGIAKLLRSSDASERAEGQFRAAEAALKRAEERGKIPSFSKP